jgi:hypothetical protein
MQLDPQYWQERYQQAQTGWDLGAVSSPLKAYIDQLQDKDLRILVPGGGNGYEAAYLFAQGFAHTYLLDWAAAPLENFAVAHPDFPKNQLLQEDFFALQVEKPFDLILEQTFFCAIQPTLRPAYARRSAELLASNGKLVGLLFDAPLNQDHPPFGGHRAEYAPYFAPYFDFIHFDTCYNSIAPRAGRELFICLQKRV